MLKENDPISIISKGSSMQLLSALMTSLAYRESKLTREQKREREERRRLIREQEIRKAKVLKNICPDCEGKLVRGKKDKKNGYIRPWTCNNCNNKYSNDGNKID